MLQGQLRTDYIGLGAEFPAPLSVKVASLSNKMRGEILDEDYLLNRTSRSEKQDNRLLP